MTLLTLPRKLLNAIAWPAYACGDCIGMKEHGCQCSAYGAVAPCTPPERWRLALRSLLSGKKVQP